MKANPRELFEHLTSKSWQDENGRPRMEYVVWVESQLKEPTKESVEHLKKLKGNLQHKGIYRNRKGGKVQVFRREELDGYPFTDRLGTYYSETGKVWSHMESEYDLVEFIEDGSNYFEYLRDNR